MTMLPLSEQRLLCALLRAALSAAERNDVASTRRQINNALAMLPAAPVLLPTVHLCDDDDCR